MDEDPIPLERTTRPVVKLWPGAPKYTPAPRPAHAAGQQRPQLRSGAAGAQAAQPAQQAGAAAQHAAAGAAPLPPAWVKAARRGSAAGVQPVGAPLEAGIGVAALPSEQEAAKEAAPAAFSPSEAAKEEGDAEEDELNSMLMVSEVQRVAAEPAVALYCAAVHICLSSSLLPTAATPPPGWQCCNSYPARPCQGVLLTALLLLVLPLLTMMIGAISPHSVLDSTTGAATDALTALYAGSRRGSRAWGGLGGQPTLGRHLRQCWLGAWH